MIDFKLLWWSAADTSEWCNIIVGEHRQACLMVRCWMLHSRCKVHLLVNSAGQKRDYPIKNTMMTVLQLTRALLMWDV